MNPGSVAAMHWIGSRSERLSASPAIRCVTRGFAVNHVRSNRQNGLRVQGVPVGRILSQLIHERGHQPGSEVVDSIVVVTKLRELSLGCIIDYQPGFVADDSDLRIRDGR